MQNHYSCDHGPRPHPKSQPVATATLVFLRGLESLSFFAAALPPGRCWGIRAPLVSHTSLVQAAHLWYDALVPLSAAVRNLKPPLLLPDPSSPCYAFSLALLPCLTEPGTRSLPSSSISLLSLRHLPSASPILPLSPSPSPTILNYTYHILDMSNYLSMS